MYTTELRYTYLYDNEEGYPRQFTGTERQWTLHLKRCGPVLTLKSKTLYVEKSTPLSSRDII